MAHNVSNEYKQVIYSGDARNKLKLLFNNVELQDADRYCEKLTIKSRIVPNGAKIFSLNNFISKEAELILHDIDTSIIQDQVSISIGTLVGNSYEYVPIGIFNIQDQPTNDKNKTTIKLRDNSVKFDFNYNAQPLIEENGGSATKLQILQDICSQAGVTCNITSFIGYLDEIGVYDNTITARQYIANIAEQAGKIATINRSGELIFVDLNNLTTWEIPIDIVEKYESGTTYKIGKVVYEDGIVRYETEDSNDDTLFLDSSNNYINGELTKEQASSNDNTYYLENTGEADLAYYEMEGKTTQENEPTPNNPSELVSVGYENLLNLVDGTYTSHGITEIVSNGEITLNGTADANTSFTTTIDTLPTGTIVSISANNPIASDNVTVRLYKSGAGNIFGSTILDTINKINENLTLNNDYDRFQIRISEGATLVDFKIKPMIEKSNTVHSYIPYGKYGVEVKTIDSENNSNAFLYQLDNPLRSIGDTKDLLYIKNGMLYVDRKIGKVVLNGNEDWTETTNQELTNTKYYYSNVIDDLWKSTQIISNYFVNVALWGNDVEGIQISSNANNLRLRINKSIANDVEALKSWLSANNTEIQYTLAEPYIEELGNVDTPSTYEGITYIDILSNINTNSYLQYRQNKTQLEAILQNTNQFNIDSLKTGKILGNPAIDSYDLIQIVDNDKTYITLATNDLVYIGVLINTFDTQIGEEAKEQNVFINSESTFKKWARTTIDNVEGALTLQAGEIDTANGRINETNLRIDKDGALLNVLANNSNIDVEYDSEGNPLSGEVREVTTSTGFTFNAEGMTIEDTNSNFKAQHRNTGTYYKEGDNIVGQYTKDGSKQKDLDLFGVYTYGKNDIDDTPMFIAQLFTDGNGEECFGHFYNRGD